MSLVTWTATVCLLLTLYTELDEDEQPESLLTVRDEEVTVEKYYSPEEKQKMEEAARLEEERRKAELVSWESIDENSLTDNISVCILAEGSVSK